MPNGSLFCDLELSSNRTRGNLVQNEIVLKLPLVPEFLGQNGVPFTKVGEPLTESKGVNHVFNVDQQHQHGGGGSKPATSGNSSSSSSSQSHTSLGGRKTVVAVYDYNPPEEGLYLGIAKGEKLEVLEAQ
jgi:hypothetical protein